VPFGVGRQRRVWTCAEKTGTVAFGRWGDSAGQVISGSAPATGVRSLDHKGPDARRLRAVPAVLTSRRSTMAVLSVTSYQITPDGYEDFLATQRQAKAVLERCGAENYRLIAAMMAGEASGTIISSYEVPDFASSGKVLDAFLADPEGMALLMQAGSADSGTAGWQSTNWVDIPL
jgi:hypothetical protein